MISCLNLLLNFANKARHHVIQDGNARFIQTPGQLLEMLASVFGKTHSQVRLFLTQQVDRESACSPQFCQTSCGPLHADRDQWWIDRNHRQRADHKAKRTLLRIGRRQNRYAARDVRSSTMKKVAKQRFVTAIEGRIILCHRTLKVLLDIAYHSSEHYGKRLCFVGGYQWIPWI